jgi:hypothetical protein
MESVDPNTIRRYILMCDTLTELLIGVANAHKTPLPPPNIPATCTNLPRRKFVLLCLCFQLKLLDHLFHLIKITRIVMHISLYSFKQSPLAFNIVFHPRLFLLIFNPELFQVSARHLQVFYVL